MDNQFHGAVLVETDKIQYALDIFELTYVQAINYRKGIKELVAESVNHWSRFAKWRYRNAGSHYLMFIARYKRFMERYNDTLVRHGFLHLEESRIFYWLDEDGYKAQELKAFILTGGPVYLGLELAQFVNTYGKNYDSSNL